METDIVMRKQPVQTIEANRVNTVKSIESIASGVVGVFYLILVQLKQYVYIPENMLIRLISMKSEP